MKSLFAALFSRRTADVQAPAADAQVSLEALLASAAERERRGDAAGALQDLAQAAHTFPDAAAPHLQHGDLLAGLGRLDDAAAAYRRVLRLDPNHAVAHFNLATVQLQSGDAAAAEANYARAAQLRPQWADAWTALGYCLEARAANADAEAALRRAVDCDGAHAGAAARLADLLKGGGRAREALQLLDAALQRLPEHALLLIARAEVLLEAGAYDKAIADYRRSLAAEYSRHAHDGLLFALNFLPGIGADEILAEHERYGAALEARVPALPAIVPRERGDRLRIGYVSPDLHRHPVARFIAPLLRAHDRSRFEIHCFYTNTVWDDETQNLTQYCDGWHNIADLDDAAAAAEIRASGIDMLVDLAGHTTGNRLPLFALKPAPVQFTWLGYLCTTGLRRIDYRLCDAHTDPPGVAEAQQVETPARLPDAQWCYAAPANLPAPTALPLLRNGYVTLGSFNQQAKLGAAALEAWADILTLLPGSRLCVFGVTSDLAAERVRATLSARGIAPDRIEIVGRLPIDQYFAAAQRVDIALDSFPYNGGTTTCDLLAGGIPVATVAGDRGIARGGVSLLSTVGLTDWIAPSEKGLPALVQKHCSDPQALARLRQDLPRRMQASALMDADRFARNVETIYHNAWQRACGK